MSEESSESTVATLADRVDTEQNNEAIARIERSAALNALARIREEERSERM